MISKSSSYTLKQTSQLNASICRSLTYIKKRFSKWQFPTVSFYQLYSFWTPLPDVSYLKTENLKIWLPVWIASSTNQLYIPNTQCSPLDMVLNFIISNFPIWLTFEIYCLIKSPGYARKVSLVQFTRALSSSSLFRNHSFRMDVKWMVPYKSYRYP